MFRMMTCMLLLCSMGFATPPQTIEAPILKRIRHTVAAAKFGKDGCSDAKAFKAIKREWGGSAREGICISLENSGFTPKAKYKLYITKLDDYSMYYGMAWANDQGKLTFENPESGPKIVDEFLLAIGGCMLGEELTISLIALDGSKDYSTRIAQLPIAAKSPDGANVYMSADVPTMEHFYVKASGFKPSEKLTCTSCSNQERMDYPLSVDENGEQQFALSPAVVGMKGGLACLRIKRENGETLKINYLWGQEAFKKRPPSIGQAEAKKIMQGVKKEK